MRISFTDRELDVMGILWQRGSGTVSEVRERLSDDLAYTTVLTVLRILEKKRYVRHEDDGRAHRFYPLVERQAAGKSELRRLVDKILGGSPELVIAQMLDEQKMSDVEVRRLRIMLDKRLKK